MADWRLRVERTAMAELYARMLLMLLLLPFSLLCPPLHLPEGVATPIAFGVRWSFVLRLVLCPSTQKVCYMISRSPRFSVLSSECSGVLSQSLAEPPSCILWRASFSSISFSSPSEGCCLRPKLLPLIFYDSCLQVIGQMVHRLQ